MNNVRLGYACINMTLQKDKKICCNKTCRLATVIAQGVNTGYPQGSKEYSMAIYKFLTDYCLRNLTAMFKIISWSRKNNITFYRMSSSMCPHITNPLIKDHMTNTDWTNYVGLVFGRKIIREIGMYAQKYGIRLTMHPDHYNQLGSKDTSVIEKTLLDLTWHGTLIELMSLAADEYNHALENNGFPIHQNVFNSSILCIHGGGVYGDKKSALARWESSFQKLQPHVKKRIALENDERNYSTEDLLPLCNKLKIPHIFDFHHYNCWANYHPENPTQLPKSELLPMILKTWEVRNMIPKFHLSDQAEGKKVGAHHDYVESIPDELIDLMKTGYKFDIMIEAKQKELATLRLMEKYKE